MKNDLKFGTSGLRGLVSALTDDVCQNYTLAFLNHLKASKKLTPDMALIVGHDLRASSPHISKIIMDTASSYGVHVMNAGALPTPALALSALNNHCPAIMVTGSHIPEDRNGLKFYTSEGEITKQDELSILYHLEIVKPIIKDKKEYPLNPSILAAYRKRCLAILPENSLQNLRIGVYQHSSVARDLLIDILKQLGAQTFVYARSDHFIPIDTEALSQNDRDFVLNTVKENSLDALISTDGDADRPLIAGSDGHFVKGDLIGLLTAQYLGADAVVTPVTSSSAIELSYLFQRIYRCRVGSPYVIAEMEEAVTDGYNTIIGFEANGGVLLGSDVTTEQGILKKLPTRDAILPILCLLGLAHLQGNSVQALMAELPHRFTASNRLTNIDTEKASRILDTLDDGTTRVHFFHSMGKITHWDTIDGLRVIFDNGDIIHYRLSGNAPEMRCYCEASTQKKADNNLTWGLNKMAHAIDKL
ncbi:phosphomannomutase [Bartonella tamiae]|uniref:phosphomannomutase n=1 Tax=Bartonella tamiae TaxID=373638 RepID=UPI00026E8306|nr:phosphomannomutase [Bartonella tamiae]EJF92793.1 hypothetical protein MEG_01963 [Bartonella tamiae Th307]